jgi:Predicted Zn-dependent peptidases
MTGQAETLIDRAAGQSRASRVQKVRSSGGIEAWLVEDYAIPLVAVNFGFKGGASQDPTSKPGTATLLAGLLDEGAGDLDSAAFHQALDDDAIELSFSADRDNLHGRMKTLSKNIERAFALTALAVGAARLDVESLERVRSQIASSLRRETNDPDHAAARLFRLHSFPGHPYGEPVKGDLAILPSISRDDLVALRERIMARDNLKIAVVGAIDADALGRALDRVFGSLPGQAALTAVPDVVFSGIGTRYIAPIELPQSTIRFGRQGLMRGDPDYDAATVVNHCLGGGAFTARLYKEVREKRGLCYSVYSQNSDLDHGAMLVGATSTKNERAQEAIDVIKAEIDLMGVKGIGEDELDKAKKYLVGSYALRFDTSRKIAGQLCNLQLDGYGVERLDERNSAIEAVTVEAAARTAKRLIGDGELLVTIAGKPVGM